MKGRPVCPGSGKPPRSNVSAISGRCPVCGYEFMINSKGVMQSHKVPLR